MRIVVVTVHYGRLPHLVRQRQALERSTVAPVAHVVVCMDAKPVELPGADVVHLPAARPLPLAAARNAGMSRAATFHSADLVVVLDVDCLPAPELLARYRAAAIVEGGSLLAGPVVYLSPGIPARGPLPSRRELQDCTPHPSRPAPAAGQLVPEPRHELFWSLSFAVTPATHLRIGGFDDSYIGYGGEDTDYAMRAHRAGVGLIWVGGATAFHQHHAVSNPPVEHLADIVRNARRFHARWRRWPMDGWLAAFAERGLVIWDPAGDELALAEAGERRAGASPSGAMQRPAGGVVGGGASITELPAYRPSDYSA